MADTDTEGSHGLEKQNGGGNDWIPHRLVSSFFLKKLISFLFSRKKKFRENASKMLE